MWHSLKNSLAVKKGAALFKNRQCEKRCEIKGSAKKCLWWYRLMTKITIQVNFVLIPSEARIKQHKLTWIITIKIFTMNPYHYNHFWVPPSISQLFWAGHFKKGCSFFTVGLFMCRLPLQLRSCKQISKLKPIQNFSSLKLVVIFTSHSYTTHKTLAEPEIMAGHLKFQGSLGFDQTLCQDSGELWFQVL